jgi:hypothetical protein
VSALQRAAAAKNVQFTVAKEYQKTGRVQENVGGGMFLSGCGLLKTWP